MAIRTEIFATEPAAVLENDRVRAVVVPGIGGRVVSLVERTSEREFLWRNPGLTLQRRKAGDAYDPNFYGGMDELLPCDLPETIDGVVCPDHGELWTLPLEARIDDDTLILSGSLPESGLNYERRMRLNGNQLVCDYRITNPHDGPRHFLWKLHAAIAVEPGDRVLCPAATARPADAAWSRCPSAEPVPWPQAGELDLALIPEQDGTTEFLFLDELSMGYMGFEARDGAHLDCIFDPAVFPCCWYFASFGGMDDLYTAVLEPCTTMPISVNEAMTNGFCSRLAAGRTLATTVTWAVTGSEK